MSNDSWLNQWGGMKLADFRVGKVFRQVTVAELPKCDERTWHAFREELEAFRVQILPTDVLYYFDSEQSEWDKGFGSEGFAIVRDGELFDTLVVKMN
jgi:hypothetical protein